MSPHRTIPSASWPPNDFRSLRSTRTAYEAYPRTDDGYQSFRHGRHVGAVLRPTAVADWVKKSRLPAASLGATLHRWQEHPLAPDMGAVLIRATPWLHLGESAWSSLPQWHGTPQQRLARQTCERGLLVVHRLVASAHATLINAGELPAWDTSFGITPCLRHDRPGALWWARWHLDAIQGWWCGFPTEDIVWFLAMSGHEESGMTHHTPLGDIQATTHRDWAKAGLPMPMWRTSMQTLHRAVTAKVFRPTIHISQRMRFLVRRLGLGAHNSTG